MECDPRISMQGKDWSTIFCDLPLIVILTAERSELWDLAKNFLRARSVYLQNATSKGVYALYR